MNLVTESLGAFFRRRLRVLLDVDLDRVMHDSIRKVAVGRAVGDVLVTVPIVLNRLLPVWVSRPLLMQTNAISLQREKNRHECRSESWQPADLKEFAVHNAMQLEVHAAMRERIKIADSEPGIIPNSLQATAL